MVPDPRKRGLYGRVPYNSWAAGEGFSQPLVTRKRVSWGINILTSLFSSFNLWVIFPTVPMRTRTPGEVFHVSQSARTERQVQKDGEWWKGPGLS